MDDDEKKFTITLDNTNIDYTGPGATVGGITSYSTMDSTTYPIDTSYVQSDGTYTVNVDTSFDTTFDTGDFPSSITLGEYGDNWPAEYKIEDMIKLYPALKLQYEKFLEIYNLCKDDYNSRKDDDVPF